MHAACVGPFRTYVFNLTALPEDSAKGGEDRNDSSGGLQDSAALLPSVNTVVLGMLCGAKYTHHTFTSTVKHHYITTANSKYLGKR